MELFTSQQSRRLDQLSEQLGVSTQKLMTRAGKAVADLLLQNLSVDKGPVGFLIGKGNNGGDAEIAAKHLEEKKIAVFYIRNREELQKHKLELKKASWIVDGLLGVGLQGEVRGWFVEAIETVNQLGKKVLAIDIPSGLSAETGQEMGCAIRATVTACLGGAKLGCLLHPGSEISGRVLSLDIGIPPQAYSEVATPTHLLEPSHFQAALKKRPKDSHKKDFGHALVLAGSSQMPGAGWLSSQAALRAGAGLVTWALPEGAYAKFDPNFAEVMLKPVADEERGFFLASSATALLKILEGKSSILLGPGLGSEEETKRFVIDAVQNISLPLVIDADALNALATKIEILKKRKGKIILTPHPGEMGRLLGISTDKVQENRVQYALEGAKKWGVIVVLKGYRTLIVTPEGSLYVNPTGNPGMASAGTGDVLGGIIAGFLAQGFEPQMAALAGVYLHGLAGDMAAEEMGQKGLIAGDVSRYVPKAIRLIEEAKNLKVKSKNER